MWVPMGCPRMGQRAHRKDWISWYMGRQQLRAFGILLLFVCSHRQIKDQDILVNIKTHNVLVRNQPVYVFGQKKQKENTLVPFKGISPNALQDSASVSVHFVQRCLYIKKGFEYV